MTFVNLHDIRLPTMHEIYAGASPRGEAESWESALSEGSRRHCDTPTSRRSISSCSSVCEDSEESPFERSIFDENEGCHPIVFTCKKYRSIGQRMLRYGVPRRYFTIKRSSAQKVKYALLKKKRKWTGVKENDSE